MERPRPDLFAYLDHRAWLDDWYQWKKGENPNFSHRVFARLAGQASPSLLNEIIKGKRNLTHATSASFCKAMSLSSEETAYFDLLVRLDRAANDKERNEVWAAISATRRFQVARKIEGESFRYLSHWFIPAVRELATCTGFQADPAWVARTLRPRITQAQAREALDTLFALGMLELADNGAVTLKDVTLVTPHQVSGLAVHNFHRAMLGRAVDAIEAFSPAERYIGGVTVSVPESLLPELRKTLAEFQDRMLDICDGADGPRARVFQIGLQLFPLSDSTRKEPR